ncbi:hypothetical protein [Pseudomonas sp. St316]|uniref:hypothetical protein n=1 Tax=Pseudomonas sp. St316 TaxID=2678257 RepID=UPI001BB4149F|nr:hypothetical protein [Pseudomonas sp. St316]
MKWTVIVAIAIAILSGCTTAPAWKISSDSDVVPKRTSLIVTTGNYTAGNSLLNTLNVFPVVRKEGEEIYVGLMSNGDVRIPIVTAQIWIDQNEVWTISSQETPMILAKPSVEYMLGLRPELTRQAQAQGLNIHKILGGYAVTGGDKAKAILKQMLRGSVLRFRTIGIDKSVSATQEVVLDETFSQSLGWSGIDQKSL